MSTIKSFEDIVAWQKARELTKFIYEISRTFRNGAENIEMSRYRDFDRGLANQIQRAAVSVMSNIAEGFDRGTRQELINYLFIAKGSCGEVRCQLYVALDVKYIDMSTFREGMRLTDECSRLLRSFIEKVKTGSKTGSQYKHIMKTGMSDTNKMIIEMSPKLGKYYNAEKGYIDFEKMREEEKGK